MQTTPNANRLHIAIFGRRNAGKSSLINALCGQDVALVSGTPGTTTDPVYRPLEFYPLGPVLLIDTPGLDDGGTLGDLRVQRAKSIMDKTDLAIVIFRDPTDLSMEYGLIEELAARKIPAVVVINTDSEAFFQSVRQRLGHKPIVINARDGQGIPALREAIIKKAPRDLDAVPLASHLVEPGDRVILVIPQDKQSPKGRLILPQQQVLRDLLDHHALCLCVQTDEFPGVLNDFSPQLVIVDSQVFGRIAPHVPDSVKLTSFSVLMARYKGDIELFIQGAAALDTFRDGDKILIAEACSHNPMDGDIGREKLPQFIRMHAQKELDIQVVAGSDFPADVKPYALVIHCGACMFNRRHVLSRAAACMNQKVPITNYGIAIAYMHGILENIVY